VKSPDALLAEGGCGLHEEIEEMLSGHAQGGNLPPRKTPIRVGDPEICPRSGRIIKPGAADTNAAHEPDTWRPKKGDRPPKDGSLTVPQVIGYCEAQVKKWRKQAKADDFKEMNCSAAYSLFAQQAKHIAELLKRVRPVAEVSSENPAARAIVKYILSAIPDSAKAISTMEAVRIAAPKFPQHFNGCSKKAWGRQLQLILRPLGVRSRTLRINGQPIKGYLVADLQKAAA
jgi:hypothetical protein